MIKKTCCTVYGLKTIYLYSNLNKKPLWQIDIQIQYQMRCLQISTKFTFRYVHFHLIHMNDANLNKFDSKYPFL